VLATGEVYGRTTHTNASDASSPSIACVLFGGNKLPELGTGLGEGLHGFKDAIKGPTDNIDVPGKPAQTIVSKPNESPQ
jgi:sec-independent protein translocase protein TatA